MTIIPSEHLDQLLDPRNLYDNPFYLRESRRDARRGQPARSYAWTLGVLAVLAAGAAAGAIWLRSAGIGIPWLAGGSAGAMICVAICGIHAAFVQGSAQKHTLTMVTLEQRRNTLQGLLLLPAPALQMVVQATVYPWVAAMRVALLGLPFYAACVAMGGIGLADLLFLYLVFAGLALVIPPCRTPARADAPAATTPTPATQTGQANAGAQDASGATPALFMMAMVMPVIGFGLMTGKGIPAVYAQLNRYAPSGVLDLAPTIILSWPLILARLLVSPLVWYGISAPPLLFALPLFLLGKYVQAARSAEYLQSAQYRDLASIPTFLNRRRLQGALSALRWFILAGYLWPWGVRDGGFAPLVRMGGPLAGAGGLLFVLLILTVWKVMGRAGAVGGLLAPARVLRNPAKSLVVRRTDARQAARHVLAPVAGAAVCVAAACLLSRTVPTNIQLAALAGRILAIGAGAALLAFAVRRSGSPLVLLGPTLPLLILFGPPALRPLAVYSPTLGMLGQANPQIFLNVPYVGTPLAQLFRQPPVWWSWPMASCAAAVLLTVWSTAAPARSRKKATEADSGPAPVPLDPTIVGAEPFMDGTVATGAAGARKGHTPAGERVISWAQRCGDNAVAVKELRVRLRGRLGPGELKVALGILTVVTVALFGSPFLTTQFGSLAGVFFGAPAGQLPLEASVLGCWYLALLWMCLASGLGVLPHAFAPERDKSTLGFLLTTPMSARSIVLGKLAGLMIPFGMVPCYIASWSLALTVAFLPTLGAAGILAWSAVTLIGFVLMLGTAAFCLAFAALFPKHIRQAGCGMVLWIAMYQVPFQLMRPALTLRRSGGGMNPLGGAFGLDGITLCVLFCAAAALGICLCLGLAIWGVRRMRKGDIAFDISKREN